MREIEILQPLEIELKKVATLGGTMALVVVPDKYTDKVMGSKRDMDTAVQYQGFSVVAMIGADANAASASFLSVPKGVAVYPLDGETVQSLFFVALERLKLLGDSHWVKRLWDNIKESQASEQKQQPEARFISATFYQFYAFMAEHVPELGQVFASLPASGQTWAREFLPYSVVASTGPSTAASEAELDALIDGWGYQERMQAKQEKGTVTLRKFRNIEHLFTLPSIATQIIGLAQDEYTSVGKMANVIQSDPVITSKLLKVVNSAFYGFHRQIDSVEQAILILGNDEVTNLSFSIAIRKILEGISPQTAQALWEHSLVVAHLAHDFAPWLGCKNSEVIYTLGLLHDLGKIVMLQRGEFSGVWNAPSALADLSQEEQASGLTHAEIGAYVAERWQLPEGIVEGILSHHMPSRASNKALTFTVHIADMVAHAGTLDKDRLNYAAAMYAEEQSLDPAKVQKTCERTRARVRFILEA